jgi:hypothetical protein
MPPVEDLPAPSAAAEDALDAALRLLADRAPTFGGGLADHGPMAADALVQLGYGWDVVAWSCRYAERLEPCADSTRYLREVLSAQFARHGWRTVLADRVPLLLPGVLAGAFHGVIRVAHAVRMVEARENPVRLAELAAALTFWVEARRPLGAPPRVGGALDPRAALDTLPTTEIDPARWLIYDRAHGASLAPGFAAHLDGVALPLEPVAALHGLAEVGRDLLLAQPHAPVVYVHAVTGPQAVAELVPFLDRTAAQEAVAYTWQALCAIHAAYRRPPTEPGDDVRGDWRSLAERAVADGDEHAIKLVLACRRGDRRRPDPRWRGAAGRLAR